MPINSKAIKNRIKSVDSTLHMAKAMELVASSKMRRATERMMSCRNYADAMSEAFAGIDLGECFDSVYVAQRQQKRICIISVAGDRGLAGGYNNNIYKKTAEIAQGKDAHIYAIGKRACEYFRRHGYSVSDESVYRVEDYETSDIAKTARSLAKAYRDGEFDALYIVYTRYVSALSQEPCAKKLLPLTQPEHKASAMAEFEPSAASVLDAVVPEYLSGLICGAVREGYLCELCARRNAMSNAEQNASEMIEKLSLQYNRARQGAITQEITEIVAGSDA